MARRKSPAAEKKAEAYRHVESESPMRPEVGTQAQFRKRKPPQTYRFDSSLAPALDWETGSPQREQGEALIAQIMNAKSIDEAKAAAAKLRAISKPFLNWAGKAERLSFDVPTLPLFIHERLSTQAIIETLKGHKRPEAKTLFDFFADPQHSIADQVLRAYEYGDKWVNRMILGDALVAMNSLLHYESLGGQVQMIYMDPPYGVKFGSNFQPFVRKRDVSHNDDEDFTREPEMVQAYRDTWECGLHSYLTYLRDRLLLCRELLAPSGSIFVQISDENLHHVREVMDEVFGAENFVSVIAFKKTGGQSSAELPAVVDYLLWYAKSKESVKYRQLFVDKIPGQEGATNYTWIEESDRTRRPLTADEQRAWTIPPGSRVFQPYPMFSEGPSPKDDAFEWNGQTFKPSANSHWKTTGSGLLRLAKLNRLVAQGKTLRFVNYFDDYPVTPITNIWPDTQISGFAEDRLYVVQTLPKVIQRCLLMTTDPGDLVLDPTCGSGTTAYVAEQWGRRWITMDVSRVPLALARQRLLTATFAWYTLKSDTLACAAGSENEKGARSASKGGPAGGFVYKRKQNNKGEEVGGIVPHVTLKSIANNEPPAEEVLVDRPEVTSGITRVCGPFVVEATIPTAMDIEPDAQARESLARAAGSESFPERMLEILRKSPVLRLAGNKTVTLKNIRPPAKTLTLSAEAMVNGNGNGSGSPQRKQGESLARAAGSEAAVAFVFGPENGAVSERLVFDAAKEANAKSYSHLYVIGFAIQPNARELIEKCEQVVGIPATYVQATPDLLMGDLLKNMRSSQIFSVCGLPEISLARAAGSEERAGARSASKGEDSGSYQVTLVGLDVFDPITMENKSERGDQVPAWFLDTDYNGNVFHVCQAFFPRTSAWDNLKKALKGTYEEGVWDHLAGATSAPFEPGEHRQIAVKVIDDRGNELMVVKKL